MTAQDATWKVIGEAQVAVGTAENKSAFSTKDEGSKSSPVKEEDNLTFFVQSPSHGLLKAQGEDGTVLLLDQFQTHINQPYPRKFLLTKHLG